MSKKRIIRLALFSLFLQILSNSLLAQNLHDAIRIGWDFRKQQHIGPGVYSRLKKLSDGALVCVYSIGRGVYLRKHQPTGWGEPVLVAVDEKKQYNYTNAELIELENKHLIYAWNARPNSESNLPYKIMISHSKDKGETWYAEQTLFVAGEEFEEGCWEPVMLQLPSGELQLYFANEFEVPDKQQNITMLRSFDNGFKWHSPEVVCFRAGSRDGMPVPICLQNNKGIALAIEDNGLNGAFKPVIIHTTMQDNWKNGTVLSDSPNRWSAMSSSDTLASPVYAGAPYLIQLHSGETILSFQSSEGREKQGALDHSLMQVYVGDDNAKDFCCKSTPFPFPFNKNACTLWCALEQTDSLTVMATASISKLKDKNGIWTSTGRIYRPMKSSYTSEIPVKWDALTEGMFIGAESQAQAKIRSAWNADTLYFHFQVADSCLAAAPSGYLAEESDGIELYISRMMKEARKNSSEMFRITANVAGKIRSQRMEENNWTAWKSGINSAITMENTGYAVKVAIPWNRIEGKPGSEGFAVFFRLHNNDAEGVVYHENMSGGEPDDPRTWLRCTLSE